MTATPLANRYRCGTLAATLLTVLILSCIPIDAGGSDLPFALSVIKPDSTVTVGAPNQEALIQWVDTGTSPGSVVRIEVERPNPNGGEAIAARVLVGRDAVGDGDADKFVWDGTDINGLRLPGASYGVRAIMDGPGGDVADMTAAGSLVIPLTFRGVGLFDDDASFSNGDGAGPFRLEDADADFVAAGVSTGMTLSIIGGSGVAIGDFAITDVQPTTLSVEADAGDSGGDTNVEYFIALPEATLSGADDTTFIGWTDEVSATTIQLSADPDGDHTNGNEIVILADRELAPDGQDDVFEWNATDTDGKRLGAGSYNIFATLDPSSSNRIVVDLSGAAVVIGNAPPTIQITSPSGNVTVPSGGTLDIAYTASDPDDTALISFGVDPDTTQDDEEHASGNEAIVETDIEEQDGDAELTWETRGTGQGTYTLFARIDDGNHDPVTASAAGRVTLGNSPPRIAFIRPSGTTADLSNSDGSGPFTLSDPGADFLGDGVSAGDSVVITGGTGAAKGTYEITEVAATVLTLAEDAGDSGGADDVSYEVTGNISIVAGATFAIDYESSDPENRFTFDLVIDYDDDDANGNETVILDNRSAPKGGPTPGSFDWNTGGVSVGTYRLFGLSRDSVNPEIKDLYQGRVLIRSGADQPYIELTGPSVLPDIALGFRIPVAWVDEATDEKTIVDLVFDDDPTPNETTETDAAEQTVIGSLAMNLDADADDDADRRSWDWHPTEITLPAVGEGDYYVFAYINNDVSASGQSADVDNAGGGGPFRLIDEETDFVADGVTTADRVRIGGGFGVTPGLYDLIAVAETELTLAADAGDSAGSGDVGYNILGPRDQPDGISVAPAKVSIPNTAPELRFRRPSGRQADVAKMALPAQELSELTDGSADFLTRGVAVGQMVHIDAAEGVNEGDYEITAVAATVLTLEGDAGDSAGRSNVSYQVMGALEALPGSSPTIAWHDRDADEAAVNIDLFLDPDATRDNGNEIQIANNLNKSARPDVLNTFAWTGTDDLAGDPVETGQFNLFATLSDGRNATATVAAAEQVNVRPDDEIASGAAADVSNAGGSGPFTLTDAGAAFGASGVEAGNVVRITAGTGATQGLYRVADPVAATTLTLEGNAGDSGGSGDVQYVVFKPNPVIVLLSQQTASTATQGQSVTIRWHDLTVSGDEKIELYYDTDSDPTSGGPNGGLGTRIAGNLAAEPDDAADSFTWNLPLSGPDFVPEGTYFIHARLLDAGTQKDISTSRSTVEVVGPDIPPRLDFLEPLAHVDTDLSGGPVALRWEYTSGRTGTITLEIDQDETANNGEQTIILDNRPQTAAPVGAADTLSWTLVDSDSNPVPTGEYFLRGRLTVLGQSPVTATAAGKLLIRKAAGDPLITLTEPAEDPNALTVGDSTLITIEWDFDDPTASAVVDLWYDTSPNSDGGAAPPRDGAFITQNATASSRVFSWNVPGTLSAGLYYIHARIEKTDGDDDDRSTAIGRVRVVELAP